MSQQSIEMDVLHTNNTVVANSVARLSLSGGDWQTDVRIAQAAVESIGASWK